MPVSQLISINTNSEHQPIIETHLESLGINTKHSPNIEWFNTEKESFKIKTVREILKKTSYANYQGKEQFYILLHVDTASIPAQNALLKLIEEPPDNTSIILTASQTDKILPTILSRCVTRHLPGSTSQNTENKSKNEPDPFLIKLGSNPENVTHSDIITHVEKYKDREEAKKYLYSQLSQNTIQLQIRKNLLEAYRELDKNGNVRLTLEHYLFDCFHSK